MNESAHAYAYVFWTTVVLTGPDHCPQNGAFATGRGQSSKCQLKCKCNQFIGHSVASFDVPYILLLVVGRSDKNSFCPLGSILLLQLRTRSRTEICRGA